MSVVRSQCVHHLQLGEADRPPCQAPEPCSEIEVFALYLLGVALACVEVAPVSPPVVRELPGDVERRKQDLQFLENLVRAPAEHVAENCVGGVVNGLPQPTLACLVPHERSLLVQFRRLHPHLQGFADGLRVHGGIT